MEKIINMRDYRSGIPCRVKTESGRFDGINFRSMSEARFALFLDKNGIKAEYEPISTGTYIPDFISGNVAIEIKPLAFLHEANKMLSLFKSLPNIKYLLVIDSNGYGYRVMKYFDSDPEYQGWQFAEDDFTDSVIMKCPSCCHVVHYGSGSWTCRTCGRYEGDCTGCDVSHSFRTRKFYGKTFHQYD